MPKSNVNELTGGFTHWKLIDSEDVVSAANGTSAATIEALPIPAGGTVRDVSIWIRSAFNDGPTGSLSTISVVAGDGDNADGFVPEFVISNDQNGLGSAGIGAWNGGEYFLGTPSAGGATTANALNGKYYASADTLDLTFNGDDDFPYLVSGELFVGAVILDPASYS